MTEITADSTLRTAAAADRDDGDAEQALIQPLDRLATGSSARIVHLSPREPELLLRLSNLGLVPGVTVRLCQRRPAAVISIDGTTLALDPEIAGQIFVRPTED